MPDGELEEDDLIARLLEAVDSGEPGALGQLVEAVYPELKRLAHFQLAREGCGHTLNTTAIVHEAFMRMASGDGSWKNRKHFLRAASTVMRHLLVDHARRKRAEKRGAGSVPLTLAEDRIASGDDCLVILALDEALTDIADTDPRLEKVIECRYFAGLSVRETAEALDMTVRTVERDWQRAKGYLISAMAPDER